MEWQKKSINLCVMSDSDEHVLPATEPRPLADPSGIGFQHQELQSQPPETTTDTGDEKTSPSPRSTQPESDSNPAEQPADMDDHNYLLRMPYSEDPTAPQRRSQVCQSCQKREL